jgi:hypothetical protein
MSLFDLIDDEEEEKGKVLQFPKSPILGLVKESKPETVPEISGLLDSVVFKGAQSIAEKHTDDIIIGEGQETLGPRTIEVLVDYIVNNGGGFAETFGDKSTEKLLEGFLENGSQLLPMELLPSFANLLESMRHGDHAIGMHKMKLFTAALQQGPLGLAKMHYKLTKLDPDYSRRFLNGSS